MNGASVEREGLFQAIALMGKDGVLEVKVGPAGPFIELSDKEAEKEGQASAPCVTISVMKQCIRWVYCWPRCQPTIVAALAFRYCCA